MVWKNNQLAKNNWHSRAAQEVEIPCFRNSAQPELLTPSRLAQTVQLFGCDGWC